MLIECKVVSGGVTEADIEYLLKNDAKWIRSGHILYMVEHGAISESFLAKLLTLKCERSFAGDPYSRKVMDDTIAGIKKVAADRLLDECQRGLLLLDDREQPWRQPLAGYLSKQKIGANQEKLRYFFTEGSVAIRNKGTTLNPIRLMQAVVVQRQFEWLIGNAQHEETRPAIFLLWKLVTTYEDGSRISLPRAIRDRHELFAFSALMCLYSQTEQACYPSGNHPKDLMEWTLNPVDYDRKFYDWFIVPYQTKEPIDIPDYYCEG